MRTFKLDGDDIVINEMVEGPDEIVQSVNRALTTRLGEFFLNTNHGFDYTTVQTKRVDTDAIADAVRECVLQDDRIDTVESVDVVYDNKTRSVTIRFVADGTEGEVVVNA